jgi:acetylornithine/succinyldiaminopimelate/putrescine aminotransferase
MPGFTFVPFNDLDAMRQAVSRRTAAVILEPIQGEAGIFPADPDYLRGLRQLCDETGAVLIFDEIQTAWGRSGRLFASEHSGVVPDIMTLAKSLGGGLYPNAAVLYRSEGILPGFVDAHPDFHETTSGGSELACRVSLKVIEILTRERLWENAASKGSRLKDALNQLRTENPGIIKAVRGVGLMVGIEYIHEFMGPMMSDALARNGVFAAYSGNAPQVMRFMPPITLTDQELDQMIASIRAAVKDMKTVLPVALLAARVPAIRQLLNTEGFQTVLFGFLRSIEDKKSVLAKRLRRNGDG